MPVPTLQRRARCVRAPCRPSAQSGSAFIELSFLVLTLLVLLAGTVELTLLLLDYNALTKSVRNAASFWSSQAVSPESPELLRPTSTPLGAAYQGQTLAQVIENLVRCRDTSCPVSAEMLPVVAAAYCRDHDGLSYVTVEASHAHAFSLWPEFLGEVIGSSITLRAYALMRIPALAGDDRPAPAPAPPCLW